MRFRWVCAGFLVLIMAFVSGCGAPDVTPQTVPEEKTMVVATIFPLADVTQNIGGDRVEVITLLPGGASPHTFEPTPRQMQQVSGADVVIQVGAGLDDWADKLTEAVGSGAIIVKVTEGMQLRPIAHRCAHEHKDVCSHDQEHQCDHSHPAEDRDEPDHTTAYGDPHVWLDPVLVRDEIAPRIAAALAAAAPADADYFAANLESFQGVLTALDEEIARRVERLANRHFVAYHSAWSYFADRYGLVEVATVQEAPGKEPSPSWIATVVELARAHGAGAIFAEPQFSTQAAQVIADEYGGRVLILDPLGDESIPGRDSYVALMRYNITEMEKGLGRISAGLEAEDSHGQG